MRQSLEQVTNAVMKALEDQGLPAVRALSPGPAPSPSCPTAAVGVRTGESRAGAMSRYLGERTDPLTQAVQEVYGFSTELELSLDLYAPAGEGAAGCDRALEQVHDALLLGLPSGLRVQELKWEEPRWDEDTDLFLRRGSLRCFACFLATRHEDSTVLTDFLLKGTVMQ